ncbi:hypothetical protein BsWGS_19865 [Bradybaena similaris]
MSKMLTQSWSSLNGIIRHNLTIVFLLIGILTTDLWGRKTPDDPRMQMIETMTNRKYDFLNQTDIDNIMSLVTKSVRHGRNFHYMMKLRKAMEIETKRLDAVEDVSSKDWQIQAFKPATYDETSLSFTECEVCKEVSRTTRCKVTRVELLVPLIPTDTKTQMEKDWIFVEINGHTVNSSRGIVNISQAVIFDLSDILLNPDTARPDGALNITFKKQSCHNVFPQRCMIYEYCNINSTILDRFRKYTHNGNKSHTDLAEEKQSDISTRTSEPSRNNHINESMDRSEHNSTTDAGKKHNKKPVKPNKSLVSSQQTTLAMSSSTDKNSSKDSNYENSAVNTRHVYDNGSSPNVPGNQNTRSLREPRAISPPEIAVEDSKQSAEQQQPQKKKRQLATDAFRDPAQKNHACGNRFDTLAEECKRRSFHVSFQRDLNMWDIIMPELKVDIGYCSGTCHHVVDFAKVSNELTAHAVIMNRVRRERPRVACSPRKMSSIPILKINNEGNSLVLENLYHTKVESCWCA